MKTSEPLKSNQDKWISHILNVSEMIEEEAEEIRRSEEDWNKSQFEEGRKMR
jgi:hypothetical protein